MIYQLCLPYYKQGDDLSTYLDAHPGNVVDALLAHSEALKDAAKTLELLAAIPGIKIGQADTHFISVEIPDDAIILAELDDWLLDDEVGYCRECSSDDCECIEI